MTGFRKRIGEAGCELIMSMTVKAGIATKTVCAVSMTVVNVDTTVQDKAVAFPTDTKLLFKARRALVRAALKEGIGLRQSYERMGAKAFARASRYAHAKQMNHAKRVTKRIKTQLGCVIRDVQCKANEPQQERLAKLLQLVMRIHS